MRNLALALIGAVAVSVADAAYEYRYIEAERYDREDGSGLRNEGFTSWMGHPSHGQVMVLGRGGHWLEYSVEDLAAEAYHLFVRGLAWSSGCEVDVYWDGELVGRTHYERPGTALKWSDEVGLVTGGGDHTLRLVGAPDIHQAPYLDVILLTTQDGYDPGDEDQDFESFVTPLPVLRLGHQTVAPSLGSRSAADTEVEVSRIEADPIVIGENRLRATLRGGRRKRWLTVSAQIGAAEPAEVRIAPEPGGTAAVELTCEALTAGVTDLRVRALEAGRELLAGAYQIAVPDPCAVSLDEYAYPTTARHATWRASFALSKAAAGETAVEVVVRSQDTGEPRQRHALNGTLPGIEQTIDLTELRRGRYAVTARFARRGTVISTITREFMIHEPYPLDDWESVERTEARGGTIYLNGRSFLGRLLYHAPADENTRSHGFNLVQCFGGDPDPTESIELHLEACRRSGMWGSVALFNNRYFLPGARFDLDHLREAVVRFREHPALWGWDLIDEPESRLSPEAVLEAAALIRQLDPNHIVWVNLCRPQRGLDYLESQDLWSFDRYPIPGLGLPGYLPWLKLSDDNLRGRRPLGTCLQTFQHGAGNLRMPTPDELRSSAYLHIIHGYRWFGYYSYYDGEPAKCLAREPELWSYTRALNGELAVLAPVILADAPYTAVTAGRPEDVFQAAVKEYNGRRYLFAINLSAEPLAATMAVSGSRAVVLFEEDRTIAVEGGVLRDNFRPGGCHVYRLE